MTKPPSSLITPLRIAARQILESSLKIDDPTTLDVSLKAVHPGGQWT
jgi:hypothetical protein